MHYFETVFVYKAQCLRTICSHIQRTSPEKNAKDVYSFQHYIVIIADKRITKDLSGKAMLERLSEIMKNVFKSVSSSLKAKVSFQQLQ